jgi:hypothetical protein
MPCGHVLRHTLALPPKTLSRWRAVAARAGTTWPHVVLALVATYVRECTGADEVILGVPVMGRIGSPAARTPAMLVNVVPLRVRTDGDAPLQAVMRELELIRPHQRYRGERLRRELGLVGGDRRLYGPVVNVLPFDYGLRFGGHRAVARNLSAGAQAVEDMAIHVHARMDGEPLLVDLDANADSYGRPELATHADGLTAMLADTHAATAGTWVGV